MQHSKKARKSLNSQDQIIHLLKRCRVEQIFGIYSAYIQHILQSGGNQVEIRLKSGPTSAGLVGLALVGSGGGIIVPKNKNSPEKWTAWVLVYFLFALGDIFYKPNGVLYFAHDVSYHITKSEAILHHQTFGFGIIPIRRGRSPAIYRIVTRTMKI